jgi:transcriptional regulator GlxA family with amidase domain
MFERLGGVADYVETRRLGRAYGQLRDPLHQHRRVFEIALNAGFASMSHFSGAFRHRFGLSPSDLRATVRFARVLGNAA